MIYSDSSREVVPFLFSKEHTTDEISVYEKYKTSVNAFVTVGLLNVCVTDTEECKDKYMSTYFL